VLALGAVEYLRKDTTKDEMAQTLADYFRSLEDTASEPTAP
jgi:hypothetical protein